MTITKEEIGEILDILKSRNVKRFKAGDIEIELYQEMQLMPIDQRTVRRQIEDFTGEVRADFDVDNEEDMAALLMNSDL